MSLISPAIRLNKPTSPGNSPSVARLNPFSLALFSLAALASHASAHGLTQVNEARPFREPRHQVDTANWKPVVLDLFLGSNFVSAYSGSNIEGVEGGSMNFLNWVNGGTFYREKPDEDWLINAAFIQRSSWFSSKGANPMPSYAGLTSLWVDLALVYNDKGSPWSYALVVSPGLSSDFKNVTPRMMRLPARASFQYQFDKTFSFELGVIYTPDFVNTPVLPLVGFVWMPNENWEIRYLLTTVTIQRHLSKDTTVGLFAAYDSASWMVGDSDAYNQFAFTSGNAGFEASQRISLFDVPGHVHFALGATFGNEARRYTPSGNDTIASVRSDSGLFTRIGLTLEF